MQKEDFFSWLSAHTFELKQLEALEVCHIGTGRWLFDTHEFREWANTDKSDLLWCHGKRTYPWRDLQAPTSIVNARSSILQVVCWFVVVARYHQKPPYF